MVRNWGFGAVVLFLVLALLSYPVVGTTFTYNEGEVVQLASETTDPDGDNVSLSYSEPLDENGEWQTTFDDAGVYNVTVSAFDGKDTTEQVITLEILNVNQLPVIDAEDVEIEEGKQFTLDAGVSDPDEDVVSITYSAPLDSNGSWTPGFEDAGEHTVTITADDGQNRTSESITVTVVDTNRAPIVKSFLPNGNVAIKENEAASFSVDGIDEDGDEVSFAWFVDGEEAGEGRTFTYTPDFDSSGEYEIRVELSDGEDLATEAWAVTVQNVNRAPSLSDLADVVVRENETIDLDLPDEDVDGDELTYTISEPVGEDGVWKTDFEDAGEHTITIVASDGELDAEKTITVTVVNVDRSPAFSLFDTVDAREGEELSLSLGVTDPDGDPLTFHLTGVDGSIADGTLVWTPDYETVTLPSHFFARMLQRLRLDGIVYSSEEEFLVTVSACGGELCTNQSFLIVVEDVNRLPVVEEMVINVHEGEPLVVSLDSTDADGDILFFDYSSPLSSRGAWTPDFDDAGEHTVIVGVSDGKDRVERNVTVIVEDVNRNPTFGRLTDKKVVENKTIAFTVPVSDPDGDDLVLVADELPGGAEFDNGVFEWTPGYNVVRNESKHVFLLTFSLSEADADNSSVVVKKSIQLTVENTNRPPVITSLVPAVPPGKGLVTPVGQSQVFAVSAIDPDGDVLRYTWKFGFFDSVSGHSAVQRRFTSTGVKEVTVTVGDGEDASSADVVLSVKQVRK